MKQKQEVKKVSKEIIDITPVEIIPDKAILISPEQDPSNKQAWIDERANKIVTGELTVFDVGRELELTDNQIEFCKQYALGENMGSGVQAAIIAYGYDPTNKMQKQQASNWATKFLKPTHPCGLLINVLLHGAGFNAANLDKQLLFVCQQNQDFKAKTLAIREANTILGRNNKKFVEVNITHKMDYSALSKGELQKLVEIGRKAMIKDPNND